MDILSSFILLTTSLFVLIKSADYAIHYSVKIAESFNLPKHIIGFVIVAVISIMPETFVSISSAAQGMPSFGLATLFGSNIADLTLVFAFIILVSGRSLKIQSKIIKNQYLYLVCITIPILFGLNGYYSELEGLALILTGLIFYLYIFQDNKVKMDTSKESFSPNTIIFLILSLGVMLVASHLTIKYGVVMAESLNVAPVLIGMFVVGLGTVLPEMMFAMRSIQSKMDELALGDILGVVIVDATIVVGLMALISPFSFNPRVVYVTGMFMVLSMSSLLYLMRTGRSITKKEALALFLLYITIVIVEFFTATS